MSDQNAPPGEPEAQGVERRLSNDMFQLSTLLERLPIGIGLVDPQGRTLWLNPAALDLHGFASLDEMLTHREQYRDVFELCYPDGRLIPEYDWPLARALRGEPVHDFEVSLHRPTTGHRRVVSYSAVPEEGTNPTGRIVFVMQDLTRRKLTEEELRRAHGLIEGITRGTDDLIAAEDKQFRFLFFNEAYRREFQRLWGREIEVGASMLEALAPWPEEQRKAQELWSRALHGESFQVTMEFGPSSDAMQIYDLRFNPVHDPHGQQIGAAHILRNVTEQVETQRRLHESEQRYRALVDSMSEMLCRIRGDGTILFANNAYARALGTSAADLTGTSLWQFIYAEDLDSVRRRFQQLTPAVPEVRVENRFAAAAGPRWTLWTIRALQFDEQGRWTEAQATGIDITDRKQAEESLRQADRRKDEFLATLAHELRNPLAPIRNAVQLLQIAGDQSETRQHALQIMHRQLEQLIHLVDDLLDISRITQGKISLRRERLNVGDVVRSAVESVQPLLDASAHELTLLLPSVPVEVEGDATRLAQVFANLLANAAKYTQQGGHIWLQVEVQDELISVSIRDTGIGIEPDHLAQLFEMFSQVAPALERSQGGLGIGLALVRGLVELHQGRVEARSAGPGKGSEFVVYLPRAESSSDLELRTDSTAPDNESSSRRILVVDDNRDSADTLALLLRARGHQVQTAFDGVEAVQAAAAFRPDLVLLDIGMPKMNGYDAAREIRSGVFGATMTLVAMTGWGQDDDKRRALEAGFDVHLTKPLDPRELERLLTELPDAHP